MDKKVVPNYSAGALWPGIIAAHMLTGYHSMDLERFREDLKKQLKEELKREILEEIKREARSLNYSEPVVIGVPPVAPAGWELVEIQCTL